MAILSSVLQTALTSLQTQARRVGTISHNISNAQTPGFSRQQVLVETNSPFDLGRHQIGQGVTLKQVRRVIDTFLEKRITSITADQAKNSLLADVGSQMESIINPLEDNNIQVTIGEFFDSLNSLVPTPTDSGLRSLAVQAAIRIAQDFNNASSQIRTLRKDLNDQLKEVVKEVNRLTDEISVVNGDIVAAENGGIDSGAANDLRDMRQRLLNDLSGLLNISYNETPDGYVNVLSNGAYLVNRTTAFKLTTKDVADNGVITSQIIVRDSMSGLFTPTAGKIGAILFARDTVLGDTFEKDLDNLAHSIAGELNRIHAEGRGTEAITKLTSTNAILDTDFAISVNGEVSKESTNMSIISSDLKGLPDLTGKRVTIFSGKNVLETREITGFDSSTGTLQLDKKLNNSLQVGDKFSISELPYQVTNGSFDLIVEDGSQIIKTVKIDIDLDRSVTGSSITDTTLDGLATSIQSTVSGLVTASVTTDGFLELEAASNTHSFRFENDTSGILAALGLNTLFSGSNAFDIKVNDRILNKPSFFATSNDVSGQDANNLQRMIDSRDTDTVNNTATFEEFFSEISQVVGSLSAKFQSNKESSDLLAEQLSQQRESISGVNIDEEAVKLLEAQHVFIASSRLISVVDEMFQVLLQSV